MFWQWVDYNGPQTLGSLPSAHLMGAHVCFAIGKAVGE